MDSRGPHDDERITSEAEMPPTDVSRVARDALRLDAHIEDLRADVRPRPTEPPAADEAALHATAALFRAATPGADEPRPEFVARLVSGLRDGTLTHEPPPDAAPVAPVAAPASVPSEAPAAPAPPPTRLAPRGVSRRSLLRGGAAAAVAAGVAGGVVVGRASAPPSSGSTQPGPWDVALVPQGGWVAVAAEDAIPVGGVRRFATEHIVGFVRRTAAGYEALSGACTHMGCLVAWNGSARTFDCPCHGGRFAEDGRSLPGSRVAYRPLPRIQTRVQDGHVWVFAPATPTATETPPADTSPDGGYGSTSGGA